MDGEDVGLLLALGTVLLVVWGALGRGSLARAVRSVVWPDDDAPNGRRFRS
jgi:hypothetical protein